MSKLISSINITPDGFCSHSDVIADDELHEFAIDLLKQVSTVLFGRITYDLFESYWPLAARDTSLPKPMYEFAQLISNVEKVIASKSMTNTKWQKTTILKEINTKTITELKYSNEVLIFGSPGLVSYLTKLELIDEYYFSIQPILVGKGIRFFDNIYLDKKQNLKLKDKIVFKSGAVTLCYQRAK